METVPILQNHLSRYKRLMEVCHDLASTLEIDVLLEKIVQVAVELSSAEAASILLCNGSPGELHFRTTTNLDQSILAGLIVPVEGSIAGWVVLNQQPAIILDAHQDERFFGHVEQATQFKTTSMIAVPLITKGKVLGVLEVLNKAQGDFDHDDLEIMMVLATQAAVAIENTHLFHQSDLVAELVHELRTPLSSVCTAAYLLQRPEISEQQRAKLAGTIHTEAQRLNELASSFMDLAWLQSGRTAYHLSSFDLLPLLEECRGIMQDKAEQKGVEIHIDFPPNLPLLEADRDKVKQVLLNLMSNAIKYNQANGKVSLSAWNTAGEIAIRVSDTGIGIPAEALNSIFEKFYRVRGSERYADGTGLGLSICKHIVGCHQGRIDVQSQPGEGTDFTVYLPLRQLH